MFPPPPPRHRQSSESAEVVRDWCRTADSDDVDLLRDFLTAVEAGGHTTFTNTRCIPFDEPGTEDCINIYVIAERVALFLVEPGGTSDGSFRVTRILPAEMVPALLEISVLPPGRGGPSVDM